MRTQEVDTLGQADTATFEDRAAALTAARDARAEWQRRVQRFDQVLAAVRATHEPLIAEARAAYDAAVIECRLIAEADEVAA